MFNFLNGIFHADEITDWKTVSWLRGFAVFMDSIFLPTILIIAGIGIVWVVVLGVGLTRARDDKTMLIKRRQLYKVAVGIMVLMMFLFLITFLPVKLPSMIQ